MALSLVYEAMPAVVDQSDRFAPLLERLAELVRSVAGQTGGMIALSAQTAGTTNGQLEHLMEVGRLSREAAEASERNRQLVQATAEQVSRAAVTCGQGGESISRFVGELRRVAAGVAEANGLLAEVLRAATEVRKTVAVVGDLAAQTNLLALNASIEAAHAGEKGAGFAIVAKEVRELAGRSRQAAEQIAGLVQAMGTHTEVAVRAVGQTATAVDQSVGDAERLEQQLSDLAGEMRTAREQSEQVSEAAAGQIQTLAAIGERGAEVQEACRACAAAADGAAEASTSVMASAADLGDLANDLAELTGLATPETGLSAYRNEQGRQAATAAIVERARAALAAAADRAGPAVLGPAVELGTARVPDLLFGRDPQANATALVDATSGSHGCSATLFVRDGDDFVRLSTSVRRGDGSRAVGTKLNGRGIAAPHLRRGEPYVGPVFILGQAFHAAYDPIRDSAGRVVGARYVGRKLADA